jgi:hypothetical protein
MTSIPEGFTQTEGPVEQKVGKAAEEREAATGGAGGGDGGGGGGDSSFGSDGGGGGLPGSGISVTGQNAAFAAMAAAENAGKIATVSPIAALAVKGLGLVGQGYLDNQIDAMTAAGNAVAAGSPLGGVGTMAGKDGAISTISNQAMIDAYDLSTFGVTGSGLASDPASGMTTNASGQTVSNTASIAAQNEALFGTATGSDGFSMGDAASTGMGVNSAGQSVSNDASIAAQDAANFGGSGNDGASSAGMGGATEGSAGSTAATADSPDGPDGANAGSSGGGGGGGKIICTAMNQAYGFGSFRNQIWLSYAAKHLTKEHEVGYHAMFLPLVDIAFKQNRWYSQPVRKVLEWGTRHRSADLRAEMRGRKRDRTGQVIRFIFEPLCYVVGKYKLSKK